MSSLFLFFFFFNDTATTEIYTLSLHDALPISRDAPSTRTRRPAPWPPRRRDPGHATPRAPARSEEHTSELQSHHDLVCRLLLEKKKKKKKKHTNIYKKHNSKTTQNQRKTSKNK